jgi:hypothetical protein
MDDKEIITKTLRDIKLIGLYDEFIKVSKIYISNKTIYTIGGFRFCLDLLFVRSPLLFYFSAKRKMQKIRFLSDRLYISDVLYPSYYVTFEKVVFYEAYKYTYLGFVFIPVHIRLV